MVGGERAEEFAHITVGASEDLSDPGGFVSAGAFVDVSGSRIDELDAGWVDGLLTRYPRQDFKRHLLGYTRTAGFPLLVRFAPFSE